MIMVDELVVWGHAKHPFTKGSCHLTTDGLIEELHQFANWIGLKREWFQDHRIVPHYDLTPRRRDRALSMGATFMSALAQARRRHHPMP